MEKEIEYLKRKLRQTTGFLWLFVVFFSFSIYLCLDKLGQRLDKFEQESNCYVRISREESRQKAILAILDKSRNKENG